MKTLLKRTLGILVILLMLGSFMGCSLFAPSGTIRIANTSSLFDILIVAIEAAGTTDFTDSDDLLGSDTIGPGHYADFTVEPGSYSVYILDDFFDEYYKTPVTVTDGGTTTLNYNGTSLN